MSVYQNQKDMKTEIILRKTAVEFMKICHFVKFCV